MINIGLECERLESVPTGTDSYGTFFLLPGVSISFSSTDLEYIWIFFPCSFVHYYKFYNSFSYFFISYLPCIHIWVLTSNKTRVLILTQVTQLIVRKPACEFTLQEWMSSAMDFPSSDFTGKQQHQHRTASSLLPYRSNPDSSLQSTESDESPGKSMDSGSGLCLLCAQLRISPAEGGCFQGLLFLCKENIVTFPLHKKKKIIQIDRQIDHTLYNLIISKSRKKNVMAKNYRQ